MSFDVAPGEVVLLLGPSGSGKSTLTLALNGLIPHAMPAEVRGTIEVGGHDASRRTVAELSTHVGMVFQDPDAQLVTGTLLDEVAFGPENLRMPVADVLARAEAALRRVGLWERRAENPDRLSGGGRQRLAIACALAMGSPLLVLDEPTANLDPQGIEEVYAALAELVAAGDRAILLVEHNLDAAIGFVDRAVVLDQEGRLVADGTVDAVLRDRAEELHAMGVWLPTSALAALRLRRAGFALDPLPLTPAELRAALEEAPPASTALGADPHLADDPDGTRRRCLDGSGVGAPVAADGAPLISVRGLSLRRGRSAVLHDIDLDVRARRVRRRRRRERRRQDEPHPGDRGRRPAAARTPCTSTASTSAAPTTRTLSSRIGFVFQNPEHQFIANTVFDELAHGLRLQRLPERRGRRAHRGAARALRTDREGADAPVPPVRRAEAPALGRHRARRGRAGARAGRAHVRTGPRPRRRAAGAPARAEPRGNDDPRRHARHAAGRRVRRPDDRDGRRTRPRPGHDDRGLRRRGARSSGQGSGCRRSRVPCTA